jgi:2-iminoacetate synthase
MDFMDLAKPGDIKHHCDPNALSTYLEYLLDYGSEETRAVGEATIAEKVAEMDPIRRKFTENMLAAVREGRRDVLC